MAISKTQSRATLKYRIKTYDPLTIQLKKGKRDYYKKAAGERDLSLAEMFRTAVEEYIENHAPLPKE